MRKSWKSVFVVLAVAGMLGCQAAPVEEPAAQPDGESFLGPLKAQWQTTRDQILAMADMIPEDLYDYRPTPEVRSFREQLQHLIGENYMFMAMIAGEPPVSSDAYEGLQTKEEIVGALRESYEHSEQVLTTLTDENAMDTIPWRRGAETQRWFPLLYNIVDNTSHYGNLVVYVRINGMVPPRTAARQQQ